ncbi:hypothetical protein CMI47_17905 [Candidatus Pacearchaeota archaeon]|nr:hypothetical protein [Candidatus Pacearchaeota archaeon]
MPTMIIEGGRPAPQGHRERPVCLIYLSEIPAPVDIGTRYFNAVAIEPNSKAVVGGIPGGVLSVISNCPTSAVQGCYVNVRAFGWQPQPARNSRLPVDKIKRATPGSQVWPMAEVMQHLMAIQAVNVNPEGLPEWMQLVGSSGKLFRPCGTAVGPRGACIGEPCPEGPCGLNQGGSCVWSDKRKRDAAPLEALPPEQPPAPPFSEPHKQQVDPAEFGDLAEAPDNGAPKRNSKGQYAKKKKGQPDKGADV